MTRKEKLYEQYLIVTNEYRVLNNMPIYDIEKMKNGYLFSANARDYSLVKLEAMVNKAQKELSEWKQAKAVGEYFATPEGAKRKSELEQEQAQLKDSLLFLTQRSREDLLGLMKPHLGENWCADCHDITYIKVYLADPVSGLKIFGHDFDLRLDADYITEEKATYTIKINMGTMGSFDPLKDMSRLSLYQTFANIASNAELIESLKSVMVKFDEGKWEIREKLRGIREQLANPFA